MTTRARSRLRISLGAVGAAFRNPDMRRLQLAWAGISFSLWSFTIALGVYAFDVGGATAVGVAELVRLLPGALASPIAGLLGDRHSRRACCYSVPSGAELRSWLRPSSRLSKPPRPR